MVQGQDAAHGTGAPEALRMVQEQVHGTVAAHGQAVDERLFRRQTIAGVQRGPALLPEEAAPLHVFRLGVVQVPAFVEAVRADDAETGGVAHGLQVHVAAPVRIAAAIPVQQNERGQFPRHDLRGRRKHQHRVIAMEVLRRENHQFLGF